MRTASFVAATLVVAGLAAGAEAREPSAACDSGEVPPTTSPAGIGVRQAGDPYQEAVSIYACSTVVAPGAVWVRADTPNRRVHTIVDGDSTNRTTSCTDGYTAARADAEGVRLYRADDGDFTFVAREKYAQDWARGTAACTPTTTR